MPARVRRPRDKPSVENEVWQAATEVIAALRERGHQISVEDPQAGYNFGGAQVIYRMPEGHYLAATESRKDGQALVS